MASGTRSVAENLEFELQEELRDLVDKLEPNSDASNQSLPNVIEALMPALTSLLRRQLSKSELQLKENNLEEHLQFIASHLMRHNFKYAKTPCLDKEIET